jgi:hypothetical protein
VNHRLNIFGYLHLADIGGAKWKGATNVGIQDLVASLQWVHDNIENFRRRSRIASRSSASRAAAERRRP